MENTDRRLTALHPALVGGWDNAEGRWSNLNGWQQAGLSTYWHETVLDLSGYSRDSLTFFPNAVGLQDPGVYLFLPQVILPEAPQQALQVLDIITSVPIIDASGILAVANSQRPFSGLSADNTGLGLLGSPYDFSTILFGMYRFFTANTNIPYPGYQQLERSQRFDSGEPNASDKLYCYRIVSTFQQDLIEDDQIAIPACRQLISGVMGEESDLVYMQRLKRSYELANQG
jgi:hypothetical protein